MLCFELPPELGILLLADIYVPVTTTAFDFSWSLLACLCFRWRDKAVYTPASPPGGKRLGRLRATPREGGVRLNGAFTDTCHAPALRLRLRASRSIPKVVSGGWCYLCVTLRSSPPRDDRLKSLKE